MKLKKVITWIVVLALCLLIPTQDANAISVKTYDISKSNVVISKSGTYNVIGSTTENTITIKNGINANLIFKGVSISSKKVDIFPVVIQKKAKATITLLGNNVITNAMSDGIHVQSKATLIITKESTGTLRVSGGFSGSGIGGSGAIKILGGIIEAIGGSDGCGIGQGSSVKSYEEEYSGEVGTILISSGKVTAIGGVAGVAGIGYGSTKQKGKITITGGTVYATSGSAGIGNSVSVESTTVSIQGGMVTAIGDSDTNLYDSLTYTNGGVLRENTKGYDIAAEKIIISGGQIFADTCYSQPVNCLDDKLYHIIFQGEVGKVDKITVNNNEYGCKDIASEGILSLWVPEKDYHNKASYIDVTYASKLHTKLENIVTWQVIQGGIPIENQTFNIKTSDLDVYSGGVIYNNKVYSVSRSSHPIEVKGITMIHKITVHPGTYEFVFDDLTIDYTNQPNRSFMNIKEGSKVTIQLLNSNIVKLGCNSIGFYVGNGASLAFVAESIEDTLSLNGTSDSYGIFTGTGDIRQYGGNLTFNAQQNAIGMYLGNSGSFELFNGICNASGLTKNVIHGLNAMKVSVHGGILNADSIGYKEEGNEEVTDYSTFMITGGEVNVSKRMIFASFVVTGGTIHTHLLGSGSGSNVTMYSGKLLMDQFVTDYLNLAENEEYYYLTPNNEVSTESALDRTTIYGGEIVETHEVTVKELQEIHYGRS